METVNLSNDKIYDLLEIMKQNLLKCIDDITNYEMYMSNKDDIECQKNTYLHNYLLAYPFFNIIDMESNLDWVFTLMSVRTDKDDSSNDDRSENTTSVLEDFRSFGPKMSVRSESTTSILEDFRSFGPKMSVRNNQIVAHRGLSVRNNEVVAPRGNPPSGLSVRTDNSLVSEINSNKFQLEQEFYKSLNENLIESETKTHKLVKELTPYILHKQL